MRDVGSLENTECQGLWKTQGAGISENAGSHTFPIREEQRIFQNFNFKIISRLQSD